MEIVAATGIGVERPVVDLVCVYVVVAVVAPVVPVGVVGSVW